MAGKEIKLEDTISEIVVANTDSKFWGGRREEKGRGGGEEEQQKQQQKQQLQASAEV